MHEKIRSFIKDAHLLALSIIENDYEIYSASCYYAFFASNLSLIFKSDTTSKHIQLAIKNPKVGVIIAKDSNALSHIEGVQIKAKFREADDLEKNFYNKKFPFARLGNGEIFALEIYFAKYTNNQLLLKEKLTFVK